MIFLVDKDEQSRSHYKRLLLINGKLENCHFKDTPPRQFYAQFRSKKGKLQLYDPDISELQIKYIASSRGKGGQKINRQRNCCEIKHIPTGITVDSQDTRDRTENYERALLLLRYRVDLEVNKETGLAIAYSRELDNFIENRKNQVNDDEIEKKQRLIRKKDELRQINIDNFRLEKYHVIESESKLVHVMTNISVHINSDRDKAMEELRLLVAQKTVHA